jgi:hypothetical protein
MAREDEDKDQQEDTCDAADRKFEFMSGFAESKELPHTRRLLNTIFRFLARKRLVLGKSPAVLRPGPGGVYDGPIWISI